MWKGTQQAVSTILSISVYIQQHIIHSTTSPYTRPPLPLHMFHTVRRAQYVLVLQRYSSTTVSLPSLSKPYPAPDITCSHCHSGILHIRSTKSKCISAISNTEVPSSIKGEHTSPHSWHTYYMNTLHQILDLIKLYEMRQEMTSYSTWHPV